MGVIDKIGEGVQDKEVGDRVVIEPNFPCGQCQFCRSGRGAICTNKGVLGFNRTGCFAEYVAIPAEFAWEIPKDIKDEDAVTIEPMAVAYHALFSSKARPGDTIAIIGLGAIGLLLTHLASQLGYQVLVTEKVDSKLSSAKIMGADIVKAKGDFDQQSRQLSAQWSNLQAQAIFECAGSDLTASLAAAAAPHGSDVVLVGLSEKKAAFQPLKLVREGITLIPSIIYDHPFDFKRVIQLLQSKVIAPGQIVSSFEPLEQLQSALEKAAEGEESKIVVVI